MNRFVLSLVAMAFASPVSAQSSDGAWAGRYLGLQLGFNAASSFTIDSVPSYDSELDGLIGGAQLGFRRQTDAFVYGAEIELLLSEPTLDGATENSRVTTTRFGGTAGYDLGRFLPYGTAGIGRMTFQDTIGFGDTASFGTYGGLGVLFDLSPTTDIGLEAVRESYQNFNRGADNAVTQTSVSAQFNINF